MPITLARLTLSGGSSFAISSLPRAVIVERGTVLAVRSCSVVFAHALPMDHMESTGCPDRPEPSDGDTVVGVAVAEAAALHNEVVDGVVWGWQGRRFQRVAGAALPLQHLALVW